MKFCTPKRTHVPVAKFDVNRCNESPLRGEKPDFWPVSKFNTGSLPLCGILPVTRNESVTSRAVQYQRLVNYCHAHMLVYVSGVNYNVNCNYTKYFAQLC